MKSKLPLLAITLIPILIFFRNINNFPLRNWDEAWYGEIIKNMASGKYGYLMPFWNGRYYFDHSPLYFWLTLPIVKLFGTGEWQVRLVSALAAIISIILVFLIGKKIRDEKLGLIASIVFLTMGQVVIRFAHGNLDSLLTALFLASFYFFLKSEKKTFPYSILTGITLGAGMLVKSWGIGLFPLFLILSCSFFKNRQIPKNLTVIIAATIAVSIWWYIWGVLNFGQTFIAWYVFNPSESRLSSPLANFSLSYYKALIRDIGFWFIPLFLALILQFKNIFKEKNPIILGFLTTSLIYISSLNFLSDKSDWYNIPAYPLISIIIAYCVYKTSLKIPRVTVALVTIVALLSIYNVNRIENIYPDRSRYGAELGIRAQNLIPQGSNVVLDDPDFTSFLYYSNQTAIYTLEDNQKGEFTEWWKISHKNLSDFVQNHNNVWIVTPKAHNLPIQTNTEQLKDAYQGYNFLKLN